MVDLNHADQRFYRCAGSLGWGLPGAMGVQCALPNQVVISFVGDGAFYYHIAELETAVRQNIPLIVVVNNNSAYNQEIPLWDNVFEDKKSINHHPKELWEMNQLNFAKIAEGFGCVGIRVEKPEEISKALQKAMSLNQPVVIDIVSDIGAFAPKAWTPRK